MAKRSNTDGIEFTDTPLAVVGATAGLVFGSFYGNNIGFTVAGGTGSFSVEFSHYHQVQSKVQKKLVSAYRPKQDED